MIVCFFMIVDVMVSEWFDAVFLSYKLLLFSLLFKQKTKFDLVLYCLI